MTQLARAHGRIVIITTLFVALLLTVIPLPDWIVFFRPEWIAESQASLKIVLVEGGTFTPPPVICFDPPRYSSRIALRTRQEVKPVFLSIGQRVDLPSSISFALTCAGGYRLPEPCRLTHLLASEA